MIATIEINSETAKKLLSIAQSKGVSVDELLSVYVPGLAANGSLSISQADKVDSFIEWAKNHPTNTPPLSDDAVSRRSIYER